MPAASPLCFTNLTARASVQQFQSPPKSLDDNFIHVCFYDTRKHPDVPAMLRAAALFNTSSVKLCALLSHPPREETAGLRIVPLRVTGAADCLYAGLSRLSHGPGPQYLMKPLLGWVMPPESNHARTLSTAGSTLLPAKCLIFHRAQARMPLAVLFQVQRVILLDTDTVVLRPISELWFTSCGTSAGSVRPLPTQDEFGRFDGAMIGVVAEQSNLYQVPCETLRPRVCCRWLLACATCACTEGTTWRQRLHQAADLYCAARVRQEKSDWRLIGKNGGVQLLDLQVVKTAP
eukprot:5348920-Pleurochrysis_carterae.AAC.1